MGRKRLIVISFSLSLLLVVGLSFAAQAANPYYEQQTKDDHARVAAEQLAAAQLLHDTPQADLQPADITDFLNNALWNVFYGVAYYTNEHDCLPAGMDELVGKGYIGDWPLNPVTGEPMALSENGEFTPFSFTLLICPPEYWSIASDPRPLSFELCVFGPDKDFASNGDVETNRNNAKWAVFPEGTLFNPGAGHAPAAWHAKQAER
jgi:hypothetical protein